MEKASPLSSAGFLVNMAAFIILIAGMKAAESLIIPILLAGFLAVICAPVVLWLTAHKVPAGLAVMITVLIVLGLEIFTAAFLGQSLANFSRNLPVYQERLQTMTLEHISWLQEKNLLPSGSELLEELKPARLMSFAANTLKTLSDLVTNTFMIMLTLIFILLETSGITNKLKAAGRGKNDGLEHYVTITEGIKNFLALKTITSIATGLLVAVGLNIQGVDFPFLWGMVAFILNYIPTIGSIIAAIPAVLLSIVQLGPGPAMITTAIYLAVNIIIGSIIEPKIMGQGVGLSTLVVFLSMTFWGWVLGPVGMLLSVPLTMIAKIFMGSCEHTRSFAIMLGTNREAETLLEAREAEKALKKENEPENGDKKI